MKVGPVPCVPSEPSLIEGLIFQVLMSFSGSIHKSVGLL